MNVVMEMLSFSKMTLVEHSIVARGHGEEEKNKRNSS
jgi:hypothetical protein